MSEKVNNQDERIGAEGAARGKGGFTEPTDTEGHKRFVRATEDDQAPAPESGRYVGKATEEPTDTEGHKRFVRATEDDEPAPDEAVRRN